MSEHKVQYFLGANAPDGFYSLYPELIDLERARAVYILKGGPGCGKSTLMRRVGERMEQAGLETEYILCSGDPDSLDGLVLPQLEVAIVDGTAPHVVEAKYPAVVERYVNLGQSYDAAGLQDIREEIIGAMDGYPACYQRAYRCLGAAERLREDMRAALLTDAAGEKLARRARGILARELRPRSGGQKGRVKQRFLGAVTHKGVLCLYDTAFAQCSRYMSWRTGTAWLTSCSSICWPERWRGAMTRWPVPIPWPPAVWPTCWCPSGGWPLSVRRGRRPCPARRTGASTWTGRQRGMFSAGTAPGCASPERSPPP